MPRSPRLPPPRARRPLGLVLTQLTATSLILAAVVAMLLTTSPLSPTWVLLLFPAVGTVWLGAGVVAWLRRPSNRVGAILTAGGVTWSLSGSPTRACPP